MGDKREELRQTVASFYRVEPGEIGPDFPLGGSSITLASFMAAVHRRTGLAMDAILSAQTVGELEILLTGTPGVNGITATAPRPVYHAQPAVDISRNGIACGIDLETVDNLPVAADYWEHPFYQAHFTREEIAWCLLQENPRMHLAARWCAKEALRKCDGFFMTVPFNALDIVSEVGRAPIFRQRSGEKTVDLPHALSISHTESLAVAVVVLKNEAASPAAATPAPAPAPPPTRMWPLWWLSLLASLAALLLAVWALLKASQGP